MTDNTNTILQTMPGTEVWACGTLRDAYPMPPARGILATMDNPIDDQRMLSYGCDVVSYFIPYEDKPTDRPQLTPLANPKPNWPMARPFLDVTCARTEAQCLELYLQILELKEKLLNNQLTNLHAETMQARNRLNAISEKKKTGTEQATRNPANRLRLKGLDTEIADLESILTNFRKDHTEEELADMERELARYKHIDGLWKQFQSIPISPKTGFLATEFIPRDMNNRDILCRFTSGTHPDAVCLWFEKTFGLSVEEDN